MDEIRAGSSSKFTFSLNDSSKAPIPAASVQTLTLSLIDVDTDTFVGPWNNRNVKGVNGGAVVDGGGTVAIPGSDNQMVSGTATRELHKAILKFTTSTEAGSCELTFPVIRVHA